MASFLRFHNININEFIYRPPHISGEWRGPTENVSAVLVHLRVTNEGQQNLQADLGHQEGKTDSSLKLQNYYILTVTHSGDRRE